MIYFHCENCGNIFPEDAAATVHVAGRYGATEYVACPDCKCDAVAQCGICRICGEPTYPDDDYCDDCKVALKKIWEHAVGEVMDKCDDADYVEAERRFIEYLEDSLGVI